MSNLRSAIGLALSLLIAIPPGAFASSHREAPITALDHAADITDFYAFVSYDHPDRVTFILNVDPFLQPSNGPNYFPFDPSIVYQIKIDNDQDARADITFQFRFQTTIRAPKVFTGFVGAGNGINAPANSPAPVAPGTPIVPPAITSLEWLRGCRPESSADLHREYDQGFSQHLPHEYCRQPADRSSQQRGSSHHAGL